MIDFEARSCSGHSGSGDLGVQGSPQTRLVPARHTEAPRSDAETPSPMHLRSFLGSPPDASSD